MTPRDPRMPVGSEVKAHKMRTVREGEHTHRRPARQTRELEVILSEARELLERRDALQREPNSSPGEPRIGISDERLDNIFEAQRLQNLYQEKMFPPDPPNHFCGHAILGGILFYNTAGLKRGDYKRLFEFGPETAHVWTHTRHAPSALVVEVDEQVREEKVWKTLGSCLRIAMAFRSNLEHTQSADDFAYDWIYHFDPEEALEEHTLLDRHPVSACNTGRTGSIKPLRFLEEIAPTLDLLRKDERYFVASQHLIASVESHHFCLVCAFQMKGYKMHPNHEPEIWEAVETISKMEVAIVQATRAVEAILGKPGKKESPKKLARAVERWKGSVDLEPHETFELVGKSYLDYYYDLFGIRDSAAHSLGELPYEMSRRLTIEAQCFAWLILWHYAKRHSPGPPAAAEALRLDPAVYASEPEDTFTRMTADPE